MTTALAAWATARGGDGGQGSVYVRADTRRLTALLRLLRQNGVSEYGDGTVTVKFAPETPTARTAPSVSMVDTPPEPTPDPEAMHAARLRALMGGLFNSDGEVG
jgi:hypothetical protein